MTPYNVSLAGSYSDLTPGANYSYYYEIEPCATAFSGASFVTPVGTVGNAASNGTVPSVTVGVLEPSVNFCARLCLQDNTVGSGYICTASQSFDTPAAPAVETATPYNVGMSMGVIDTRKERGTIIEDKFWCTLEPSQTPILHHRHHVPHAHRPQQRQHLGGLVLFFRAGP